MRLWLACKNPIAPGVCVYEGLQEGVSANTSVLCRHAKTVHDSRVHNHSHSGRSLDAELRYLMLLLLFCLMQTAI